MKSIKVVGIACLLLVSLNSFSTVHVINQSGMYFTPANKTVNVGDVIHWVWSDGNHTTSSRTIPVGATPWDAELNSTHTTFDYTVTVAGSYTYACTYHESMGMTGGFTAVVPTGIKDNLLNSFLIYPNPAESFINLRANVDGDVILSDILGKNLKKFQLSELNALDGIYKLDISELENGVYILSFSPINDKRRLTVRFIKR